MTEQTAPTEVAGTVGPMVRAEWAERLLEKAERNIAKWGLQDVETLGLAVTEEAGELAQAILKRRHEGGTVHRIAEEADDLGALCLQVRARLARPGCAACDRGDYMLGHSDECPNKTANSLLAKPATKPCTWIEDADGNWRTGCNEIHIIIDGTPSENGYVYCPYCGLKIETVIYNAPAHQTPGATAEGGMVPPVVSISGHAKGNTDG